MVVRATPREYFGFQDGNSSVAIVGIVVVAIFGLVVLAVLLSRRG